MEEKTYKYNAFISYRHISPDKDIASKLQKKLENYKPPRALIKGKKFKGWRVFRDETELPTSSNLSADIKVALENSEYLIVVCSEETGKSRWCLEEIEYFKALHDGSNSNIMTLLVKGNPEDAFPETLCRERVHVADENGTALYEDRIIEPLAANVTANSKKESLKKLDTEVLRIAAPILGSGYDDLYNREQKKKIRRIITAAGVIIAMLAVFLVYNSTMLARINAQKTEIEIQKNVAEENMRKAQENEEKANEANRNLRIKNSEILATQSKFHLEQDDIFSAVRTALEAMPGEHDDFPADATAKYVLATAVNAYSNADKTINNIHSLSGYVDFMDFSETGNRIFARDTSGNIYVIDCENNKAVKVYTPLELFGVTDYFSSDIAVDKDNGLVLCKGQIVSINLNNGSVNWYYDSRDAAGLVWENTMVTNPKADYIFLPDNSVYRFITKNGETAFFAGYKEDAAYDYNSFSDYVYMADDGTVYMVRPETSDIHVINPDSSKVYPVEIRKDDQVLCVSENQECIFINIHVAENGSVYSSKKARMLCINKNDNSTRWNTEYTVDDDWFGNAYYNTMFEFTHKLPNVKGEYDTHNGMLVVSGTHLLCFDIEYGNIYYNTNEKYEDRIIYCAPNTTEYSLKMATPNMLVTNAYLYRKALVGNNIDNLLYDGFYTFDKERKLIAHSGQSSFALASEKSSEISIYHNMSFDNHIAFSDYPDTDSSISVRAEDGNGVLAVQTYDDDIIIYDTKNDVCKAFYKETFDVDHMIFKNNKLLIIDTEDGTSKVLDYSGNVLEEFNLKNMIEAASTKELSTVFSLYGTSIYESGENILCCSNDSIYTINLENENVVVKEEIVSEYGIENYSISDGNLLLFTFNGYNEEGDAKTGIACFNDAENEFSIISENGKEAEFQKNSVLSVVYTTHGDRIAFVNMNGYIGICNYGGDSIDKILLPLGEINPLEIKFTPDGKYLIAKCADGRFVKFDVETKTRLEEFECDFEVKDSCVFEFLDNESFYISETAFSSHITLIDINSMQKLAEVEDFFMYMKSEKKFICNPYNAENKRTFGYYNYLSTEELKKISKDFLDGK